MDSVTDRSLYDRDFVAWTEAQALELRRMAATRVNTALDLEHLAEEVEELGQSFRHAAHSQTRRALRHLLKLSHSRHRDPPHGWRRSVRNARAELDQVMTATIRTSLDAGLDTLYRQARGEAQDDLAAYGEHPDLPTSCPYTLDQVLDEVWWPPEPQDPVDGEQSP